MNLRDVLRLTMDYASYLYEERKEPIFIVTKMYVEKKDDKDLRKDS